MRIRDDVAFFQAVQSVLSKRSPAEVRSQEELDHTVRQIISRAVTSEGVVDIFAAAGRTWFRRVRSPRCWNRPCAGTRTGPSRRHR